MTSGWVTSSGDGPLTVGSGRTSERPSRRPQIFAVGFIVLSALLALVTAPEATLARVPIVGPLGLAVVAPLGEVGATTAVFIALFGYLLTPFGVVASLACARRTGIEKLDDPWFDRIRLRAQMKWLQVATVLAFIVAVPHIFILARSIQGLLGLGA